MTVDVCLMFPPAPVMVIAYVPVATVAPTIIVMVEVPAPAPMDVGLKVTVTPEGWPVALNAIAESKPPETAVVMVDVPLRPCACVTEAGEADTVKLGDVCNPASALIRPVPFGLPQPVTKS